MADIALVVLDVDASGVVRGVKLAEDSLKGFNKQAKETEDAGTRLGKKVADIGGALGGPLGRGLSSIGSSTQALSSSFTTLTGSLGTVGTVALGTTAGLAALTAGALALGAAFIRAAIEGAELAGRIINVSDALDLSTTQVQKFDIALKSSGGSIQNVESGMATFQSRLVEITQGASKDAAKALDRFGIDAEKAAKTPERAFLELGKSLGKVSNQAERLTLAKELLGKSALKLVPVMMDLSNENSALNKELENSGAILSEDVVRGANNVGSAFGLLQTQFDNVKIQVAHDLGPTLIETFNEIGKTVKDLGPLIQVITGVINRALQELNEELITLRIVIAYIEKWRGAGKAGGVGPNVGRPLGGPGPNVGRDVGGVNTGGGLGLGGASNLRFFKDTEKKGEDAAKKAARELEEFRQRVLRNYAEIYQAQTEATSALNERLLAEALNFLKQEEAAVEASYARREVKGEAYFQELGRIRQAAFAAEMADIERQIQELEPRLHRGGVLTQDQLQAQQETERLLLRRNELETARIVSLAEQSKELATQTRELAKQRKEFAKRAELAPEREEILGRAGGGVAITTKFGILSRLGGQRTAAEAAEYEKHKQRYEDMLAVVRDYGDQVGDILGQSFGDALSGAQSFFDGVKEGFRNMLADIAAQLARNAVTFALTRLFGGTTEGGFFQNLFKFKQMGGATYAGQAYIVGERGPELFIPQHTGQVVPGAQGAGSGVWNINIANREAVDTRRSREQKVADFRRMLERGARYD